LSVGTARYLDPCIRPCPRQRIMICVGTEFSESLENREPQGKSNITCTPPPAIHHSRFVPAKSSHATSNIATAIPIRLLESYMCIWLPVANRSADRSPSVTSRLGYFFRAVSEWIDLTYTSHLQGRSLVYLTQQLKGLCLKILMFEHASQRGLGFLEPTVCCRREK
jgi:hypothetical protein